MMEKEKFVFLTGLKPMTVVSTGTGKSKSGSKSPCCKKYKKGKEKCEDCPEGKAYSRGLKLM